MQKNSSTFQGFTLIEMLITIAIAGILLSLGVPSYESAINSNRLTAQGSELISTLILARSEAVKRGEFITVCKSNTAGTCGGNWEDGWIVFVDLNNSGSINAGEEILLENQGFDNPLYTLRGNANVANRITFSAQGQSLASIGQLALCYDADRDGTGNFDDTNAKVFTISGTGRVKAVEKANTDVTIASCTP